MCILICRVGPEPLLAANRDELYARPFSPPRPWLAVTPFWAPRDDEEGGTWIGVNRGGLMAAITNRSRLSEQPGRASRGRLVAGVLGCADIETASAWLTTELKQREYNPFQLWAAQGERALLVAMDEKLWSIDMPIEPGIHVLSNLHDPGEIDFGLAPDAGWEEIRPILADSEPRLPRGYSVCKRAGWRGTVASALIEPHKRFLFAPGPPDECDYTAVPGYGNG